MGFPRARWTPHGRGVRWAAGCRTSGRRTPGGAPRSPCTSAAAHDHDKGSRTTCHGSEPAARVGSSAADRRRGRGRADVNATSSGAMTGSSSATLRAARAAPDGGPTSWHRRRTRSRSGRGRRGRDPRGDGRPLPRRRLQRAQRAHRERHRAQRHHARSFGSASGVAEGVPLTIELTVLDISDGGGAAARARPSTCGTATARAATRCTPQGVTDQNYLRGVQEADADGKVTFTSIFPAATPGRWPHIHFEVYPSLDDGDHREQQARTSQLALPEDVCDDGLRHRRLRAERRQPGPDLARHRHGLQRRLLAAAGEGLRLGRPARPPPRPPDTAPSCQTFAGVFARPV